MDLTRLSDYFREDDVEWKPITISKKTNKGLAAAYITNRAIMDRLDEVCGPENWKNEFKAGPDGGVLCGLSVRVGDEWVTKWDGAENSDIEPIKGGLSNSMRRAAVQWGIGRYLYHLPSQWVPVDERGRFINTPRVPPAFIPGANNRSAHAEDRSHEIGRGEAMTEVQEQELREILDDLVWTDEERSRTLSKAATWTQREAAARIRAANAERDRRLAQSGDGVADHPYPDEDWSEGSMFDGVEGEEA